MSAITDDREAEAAAGELAPSEVRAEVPTLARVAGAVGLFLLTAGAVTVIAAGYGRGLFPEGAGYLLGALGVTLLLVHAARDGDVEVRRLYGLLAAALLVGAVVVSVYPHQPAGGADRTVGALLLPWGVGAGLLSLVFFVPFARHETDDPYRSATRWALLTVGAALTVGAVGGGIAVPDFLVGPGVLLAVLGLGFVAAYLGQVDTSDGLGFKAAVALGVLGAVALAVAFGRAVAPTVLHEGPAALKTAARSYDVWKVAARVAAILAGLGVASLALNKRTPLPLRAAFGAVGVAVAGLFVAGSVATLMPQQPAPFLVPYGLLLGGIGLLYLAVSAAVVTDNPLVVLTRRELAAYFYSPIAYLVLFGMAAASGLGYGFFVSTLFRGSAVTEPIVQNYPSATIVAAFQVVFLVPVLTMRLFSEEKRTGTLEVLLTAPVNEGAVVLSKFLACWLFYLLCWAPAGLYLVALRVAGGAPFDYRPMLSYYLALAACGVGYIAMGLFFSSLTRNQIIAAVLTFAGMMFLLLTVWARDASLLGEGVQAALSRLDYWTMWQQALSGQLAVQNVLVYLSLGAFWLFLTTKVLEARKWG